MSIFAKFAKIMVIANSDVDNLKFRKIMLILFLKKKDEYSLNL